MTSGQRRIFILVMTIEAEFFCLFFTFDSMQMFMDIIVGQGSGRLLGRIDEKNKDACTESDKQYVDDKQAMILFSCFH